MIDYLASVQSAVRSTNELGILEAWLVGSRIDRHLTVSRP